MPNGEWIQLGDGGAFDFDRPRPVPIEVIARSLSQLVRFYGHGLRPMSVAQHSCLVADLVEPRLAAHALLHDAAECIIGDIASPLKTAIGEHDGGFLRNLEHRVHAAIIAGLGLAPLNEDDERAVKRADEDALAAEVRDNMRPGERPLLERGLFTVSHIPRIRRAWSSDEAEERFLERWRETKP